MSGASDSRATELAEGVRHYVERFDPFAADAGDPSWLDAVRREAISSFADRGFPTTRLEEWRYTNVASIAQAQLALGSDRTIDAAVSDALVPTGFDVPRAVFVDGRAQGAPAHAGDGLLFQTLAEARASGSPVLEAHLTRAADWKHDAFTALNTAFLDDGAVVEIEPNARPERGLHLLFVATGGDAIAHPRTLIVARTGSASTVVLDFTSTADAQTGGVTNSVCEVFVEQNAQLELVILQREGDTASHVSNLQALLERDAGLKVHTLTVGGALVRNELGTSLAGDGAHTELRGLFFGGGEQHVDNHTLVEHVMPHCSSNQLYKGVLTDRAKGVFRGRVLVRPDAQKSDAQQSNPNLLLSAGAEIDTKPQLEIYADDVKCSHGATTGRLDDEALFYLRSRGLSDPDARTLLTRAFADEIAQGLPDAALAAWAEALLHARLEPLEATTAGVGR